MQTTRVMQYRCHSQNLQSLRASAIRCEACIKAKSRADRHEATPTAGISREIPTVSFDFYYTSTSADGELVKGGKDDLICLAVVCSQTGVVQSIPVDTKSRNLKYLTAVSISSSWSSTMPCTMRQTQTRTCSLPTLGTTGVETRGMLAHLSKEVGVDVVGACLTNRRGIGLFHV